MLNFSFYHDLTRACSPPPYKKESVSQSIKGLVLEHSMWVEGWF